jgi:hypothetical protein
MVQIPEAGTVHKGAGQDARRNRGQHVAGIGKRLCGRLVNRD